MTEESKSEEKEFVSEEIKDEVHELQDAEQEEEEEEGRRGRGRGRRGRRGRGRDMIIKHQLNI